jgi:hypothetical protein
MAAIGIALWKYVMRYAPHSPDYFNRDRFVLSNGRFKKSAPSWIPVINTDCRPHMPFPIHIPPPYWLQGHDI